MARVFYRDVYDQVVLQPAESNLVQQHFKEEVDINTIVRRFGVTGQLPQFMPAGVYGDFTGIEDYESAVAQIERAQDGFMELPAEVREKFGNDVGVMIRQAQNMTEDDFGKLVFPVPPVVPPGVPPA